MNYKIRELDIFLRVSDESSFSAAGRALDCDPSTISKVIQRLEDRLGVRLFNRTSRALALTQEGKQFREAAQRVIEAIEEAETAVGCRDRAVDGVLRLNSSLAFIQYHVAPHLREFLGRHPRLRIEIVLTTTPVDMFEHQIDISLRGGYIPDSSLVARRIASSRWIICAAPAYLQRAGTPKTLDDLQSHNCLNFLPGSFRSNWPVRQGDDIAGFEPKGNVSSNSPDLLRWLAIDGLGVARLSHAHVGNDLARGVLVPLLERQAVDVEEPVFAVYASRRNLSPRVRAFLDFLQERLSPSPMEPVPPPQPRQDARRHEGRATRRLRNSPTRGGAAPAASTGGRGQ
ncbi:LysR family transcriptional regulator [Piscinibacter koreensis]|uniref:LysR family transcriptional regulator n=1 Tax=Piscinibacter koreensis TaxID=2742824 RepID=A0A7Y6NR01_9BURK|nr:LysR family transcriptional regulator [Schlegelella koreensis]NUZ07708.1 LysR family transcriptional regulator [Schlegelella koreensis]